MQKTERRCNYKLNRGKRKEMGKFSAHDFKILGKMSLT